jgi:hypothetical protein
MTNDNVNELGDEFHYLFKSTFFNCVRAKFLPRNICNNTNVFVLKFKVLMNKSDLFTLTGIAKFCKIVIKILKDCVVLLCPDVSIEQAVIGKKSD